MVIYSTLKRKTPLQARTKLKVYSSLTSHQSLRDSYVKKARKGFKKPPKRVARPYTPKYAYRSIFTEDLSRCVITGTCKSNGADIHIHHIFGASNKANSEKYGFLIPLRADWHDMADYGVHFNKELDLKLKMQYYIRQILSN